MAGQDGARKPTDRDRTGEASAVWINDEHLALCWIP